MQTARRSASIKVCHQGFAVRLTHVRRLVMERARHVGAHPGDALVQRMTPLLLLLVLVVTAERPATVHAQQTASIAVTLDRDQVTVGDRIMVTVVLRVPDAAQPDLGGLERRFGDLNALVIGLAEERPLSGGMKEIRIQYEVAAFSVGQTAMPGLEVAFTGVDGAVEKVTSAAVPITVVSVLPPGADAADVRDLKPQIDLRYSTGVTTRTILIIALAVFAGTIIAGLVLWSLWRRRGAAAPVPVVVVAADTSPEVVARVELDETAALDLSAPDQVRDFHARLAACIRRYLSERHGFPAFAMTTNELRACMEQHGVSRWQARLTAGLLSECDAVGYARYTPARERAESNLSMAYEIVALTDEQPAAPEPAPEAAAV